jgi:hypothetical protein
VEDGLLRVSGAQEPQPDKWVSLATIKFIGGLQTQRSPFASIDTRYNTKFLGGKPDALIAGLNVEISNELTLIRRPGLSAYGVANIPTPTNFFDWQLATTGDINLVIDTETGGGDNSVGTSGGILRYTGYLQSASGGYAGIYLNKSFGSKQTNFFDIVNTMYMGNGKDLYKNTGPNLLYQSNTFGVGAGTSFSPQTPWVDSSVTALTGGQSDPLGGVSATLVTWATTGPAAYLQQTLYSTAQQLNIPQAYINYTPIANNTFTFSLWAASSTGTSVSFDLTLGDQNGNIQTQSFTATGPNTISTNWTKFQITATFKSTSNTIYVSINSPSTTSPALVIYGAQLEVGGPATTTQITTTKPQGMWLWGITAPTSAPTVVPTTATVATAWAPSTHYATAIYALTAVSSVTPGTSTTYAGTFPNSASNVGYLLIQGFGNPFNNGTFQVISATTTHVTVANTIGVVESMQTATATPTVYLTSVMAATGTATYFGTIYGGGGNYWAGYAITIQGFANYGNNGTFYITSSTGVSITVINTNPTTETPTSTPTGFILGQAVTDSNGDLEVAIASGTSGTTAPKWSTTIGGTTPDGTNQVLFPNGNNQAVGNSASSASVTVAFPTNPTMGDTLLAFVASNGVPGASHSITDSNSGDTWNEIALEYSGPFGISMWICYSCAGGATSITATQSGSGVGIWLGIIEVSSMASVDAFYENYAASIPAGTVTFQTGLVATATTHDFLLSFILAVAGNQNQNTTVTLPANMQSLISANATSVPEGYMFEDIAWEYLTTAQSINPQWTVKFAAGGSRCVGITAALVANSTTTLIWQNYGAIGLSATIGFQYYYAFMNSYTGHLSNVSPISSSTGVITGVSVKLTGVGMQVTPGPSNTNFSSALYSQDPQVDTIVIFRNTDGGAYFYQLAQIPNPGNVFAANVWNYTDTTPSAQLNTSIFAPISDLNSLPPAGLVNMEYFEGRMWGSVANYLYYNTANDNAALVNVTQNGVPAESWDPDNYIPFNAPIVRSLAVGNGLMVFTTTDTWMVSGQNLLTGGFNQQKVFANHGLRSYNAVSLDGNMIYMYTSDREMLQISPNSGVIEIGYPIGDTLETGFSPLNAFVVRHVAGSRDNAVFLADGATGWYRLNPNQQGASMQGEPTPVWSPFGSFTTSLGGIGAIASIEVQAGTIQLLVGQRNVGPLLYRNLSVYADNTIPYNWSATIGSILLATPGKLAEIESITTEMNNIGGNIASQCEVLVLIDEISGNFEQLLMGVYDPPQFYPVPSSSSVLAQRFYLSQGSTVPVGRHIQIQLQGMSISGVPASTRDEMLAVTIRGCLVPEQI